MNIFNLAEYADSPLFKLFSKRITGEFCASRWAEALGGADCSRLKFYKQIKSDLSTAKYTLLPFFQRRAVARLRCSSHVLEIEKGRHKKKAREDRLCLMCPDGTVEDENHFLSHCVAYNALRQRHGYTTKTPTEIMSDMDQNNLSIYISKSFNLRKETLELG